MSIARPDTSRRREPKSPGRRFGPCTKSRTTRAQLALFTLAFAAFFGSGFGFALAATAEDDDAGPIVLDNEDVARLHARPGLPDDATRREPGTPAPVAAGSSADDLVDAQALEADLRSRLDRISQRSMGSVETALDARMRAAQDELAVAPRPRSSAAATATAPAAPRPGNDDIAADADGSDSHETDSEVDDPRDFDPEPACIYGARGQLLHSPEGRTCRPVRAVSQRTFESGASEARAAARHESVGCVYGSRGQLLYASAGVECARTE